MLVCEKKFTVGLHVVVLLSWHGLPGDPGGEPHGWAGRAGPVPQPVPWRPGEAGKDGLAPGVSPGHPSASLRHRGRAGDQPGTGGVVGVRARPGGE